MLPTIRLEKIIKNNEARIGIFFLYNEEIIQKIRILPKRQYSADLQAWHIPFNQEAFESFKALGLDYEISPNFELTKSIQQEELIQHLHIDTSLKSKSLLKGDKLKQLVRFSEYLKQQRYAPQTIWQYESFIYNFLVWTEDTPLLAIDLRHIKDYNYLEFIKKKKSSSSQNIWISALKIFLNENDCTAIDLTEIERPRKSRYIPDVLSIQKIKSLINSYKNIKHKAIIATIYSCGLRRSEVLNLRLSDIDSERGVVRIHNSKGANDRDLSLPPNLLQILREYYIKYKPQTYLFEGAKGERYSASSVRKILIKGVSKIKVRKKITVHSLRHSYATHLVEKQVNLRYIQEALGHKSSRTTEIYTKLSKTEISKMVSPIDDWGNL